MKVLRVVRGGGGGHTSLTLPAGSNFFGMLRIVTLYTEIYIWAPLFESICMQELINTDFSTTRLEAVFTVSDSLASNYIQRSVSFLGHTVSANGVENDS